MHLNPIVQRSHVEEAHRIFKISTLNAAASGMSNQSSKEVPGELINMVSKIEEAIKRRVAIGTRISYPKLQQEMSGRFDNQRAIDLAILGMVKRDDFTHYEGRKVLERKRWRVANVSAECVAPATLTVQGDSTPDHVGPPIPCCAIKLVDVPEMNYYAVSGQGEICIKGTNVFMGYFKEPERTKETLDEEGWLHTGDVGTFLSNGTLKIIDRKKHIFKLSQGEYIAPEKIENEYLKSQYVAQIYVYGESLKSCVIAVVVPDVENVKYYAAEHQIPGTLSVLSNLPEIKSLILNDITELGKKAGLKSFEQVKDIYLHPDVFSVQNGLLTPTLKSKRPELRTYFKPQLEDMYSKLD